ncbi:MAG: hypothetical protein AAF423_10255 [Pseudomonadota bacterium]
MNTGKLLVAVSSIAVAMTMATPGFAAKADSGKSKSIFSQSVSGKKKTGHSFGAIFRRDAGVNKNRRVNAGRGPGFELGFDGHSGGT